MSTNGVNSSPNGTWNGQDRRRATVIGEVATAGSAANRKARNERIYDLQERVAVNKAAAVDTRESINAAEERRAAIPEHLRGWPLEIVFVLALISICFEYIPASLFTQVFTTATSNFQLGLLTVAFTTIGALLALFLGELIRRMREPARQHVREKILLAAVGAFVVTFLFVGYELRIAYTNNASAGGATVMALTAPVEALALTLMAAIGIAFTVISSYYREGIEAFRVRWAMHRLLGELATNEAHLKANQRDLDRAMKSAYNGSGDVRITVQPDAPQQPVGNQPAP